MPKPAFSPRPATGALILFSLLLLPLPARGERLLPDSVIKETSFVNLDFSAFPALPDATPPAAKLLYVATDGSDPLGDGRPGHPYRTIHRAVQAAVAGDTIVVRGGIYPERNEEYDFRALVIDRPDLTIMASPGERVLIRPEASDVRYGVEIDADHVTLLGLDFDGFAAETIGFGVPTVHDIRLCNLEIRNTPEGIVKHDGLLEGLLVYRVKMSGISLIGLHCGNGTGNSWRIERCRIEMASNSGSSGADAFAIEHGDNLLLIESEFTGAAADGIDIKGSNAVIYGCTVARVGRNGIKLWQGGDVINTLVHHTGADAAIVGEAGARFRLLNCTIGYHNFHGLTSYNMSFGYDTTGHTSLIELVNCIIFNTSGGIWFNPDYTVRISHCLFHGMENGRIFEHGAHLATLNDGSAGFAGYGSGNQVADPGLDSAFRPRSGSPAIDRAADAPAPGYDHDRIIRPLGAGCDIGAYEYRRDLDECREKAYAAGLEEGLENSGNTIAGIITEDDSGGKEIAGPLILKGRLTIK